jgi:hypothetical protein
MSRLVAKLVECPARRDRALGRHRDPQGFGWRRARLRLAIHTLIVALAVATPIGAPQAEDAPLGAQVRVKGLPVGVALSGGRTDAERTWIVPLRGLDHLKVEVPPVLAEDFVFYVELVSDDGVTLAKRAVELRVTTAAATAPSAKTDSAQRKATASMPPINLGSPPQDLFVSVGPHFRIKGLPADVTLSGGDIDAERARVMPLSNGEQAWMVPLWAPDSLKIEFPSAVVGNLDLLIALADNVGGALVERSIALRVKPVIVAAPSRPEAGAEQRREAAVATPALPPGSAAPAAPSRPEPDAEQRRDAAVATPAPPPSSAAPAAPSRSEPGAEQRREAAVPTRAPAMSERKCAAVACQAPTEELEQAERLVRLGDRYLAQGNIVIARQYFLRAADLGLAMAALKIAETYDPNELTRFNVYGVKPNLAEARRWYQRAIELDMPEAQARVQRLGIR